MTDSLDEILSANQKLYVLNQKLTEENKVMREALELMSGSDSCDSVSLELANKALAKVKK